DQPSIKVVYIAPIKDLARVHATPGLYRSYKLVELTRDATLDIKPIERAVVITTTREKWDSISRNWK
ncbi:activating signal cointegrator 1 complex subunit, partial [Mortierella polycephala]